MYKIKKLGVQIVEKQNSSKKKKKKREEKIFLGLVLSENVGKSRLIR